MKFLSKSFLVILLFVAQAGLISAEVSQSKGAGVCFQIAFDNVNPEAIYMVECFDKSNMDRALRFDTKIAFEVSSNPESTVCLEMYVYNSIKDIKKTIGIAKLEKREEGCWMLDDIAIDEEYQRKGLGREFIKIIEQQLQPKCIILCAVMGAAGFYHKLGFIYGDPENEAEAVARNSFPDGYMMKEYKEN
jgi:GNAT superfamily N-acetyltransferase